MSPPILLIVHQETSNPGRVGEIFERNGVAVDRRCPNLGDALPEHMDGHAGAVVFGGPMSANDGADLPGIAAELSFVPIVLESEKPFLGICLGAQILAHVLGATVGAHPEGLTEIGYAPIMPTAAGSPYFDEPMTVYQWHREYFSLPAGATLLATGEVCHNQAYRYGAAAFGIQFHPEVTRPMMERWTTTAAHCFDFPGAQPKEAHFAGFDKYDAKVDAWINRFLADLFPVTNSAVEHAAQ